MWLSSGEPFSRSPRTIDSASNSKRRAVGIAAKNGGERAMLENDDEGNQAKGSAIAKMCSILKALTETSPQRLNELADRAELNRTTAFRILEELVTAGFVVKRGQPPRYDFGPEALAMASVASRSLNVQTAARPSVLRLAQKSGDTVLLTVRSGSEAVCIDLAVGGYPIRANRLKVGNHVPLGISAGSMALLAWLPVAEREAVLDITCSRLSAFPRFSREKLQKYIEDAQESGIVKMYDIIVDGLGAIAIPLRDQGDNVLAALSIASMSQRIQQREEELTAMLRHEARSIDKALWQA
jgi:DNA-binding IclR family transcriptional regulator